MDKTSGRKFGIRFFPKYLAIQQKSSKTVIALEGKPISAYPFRLFLLSLGPIYEQDITSKAIYKLVTFLVRHLIISYKLFEWNIVIDQFRIHWMFYNDT
jgi:hypothetical protein